MPDSILVAYTTVAGSTKEVAENLGMVLKEDGFKVDILPLKEISSVEGYKAIIIGAPLYMFHWHKDAHRFLEKYRKNLINIPIAVFALGPFNDVEKEWNDVKANFVLELTKHSWLIPVDSTIFGGKFDPSKLKFPFNLIPALKKLPTSDIRDWDKIRFWADNLASKIK